MKDTAIVYRKELTEILRDRRTLFAIALAALATPIVLFVISQVTAKTATQTYTVGYSGQVPQGLDVLFNATGLKLVPVADPGSSAKQDVDLGLVFTANGVDEYYDPTRQSAQVADLRLQDIIGRYDAAKIAATLQQKGVDLSVLSPLPVTQHPLTSPAQAAGNTFLSFFLPYILITMCLTGGLSAALDSSAGERERKTLESLLMTPAPRSQILVGKILAVTTISLAAAFVAIASMLIALTQIQFGGRSAAIYQLSLSPLATTVMVWLAILLAASFSSVDAGPRHPRAQFPPGPGLRHAALLHHDLPGLDRPLHPGFQPEPGLLPDPDPQRGARPPRRHHPQRGGVERPGRDVAQPGPDGRIVLFRRPSPFHARGAAYSLLTGSRWQTVLR